MSIITENPVTSALAGGLGLLVVGALGIRRFGVECERAWLNSLAAPQEPFEAASDAHALVLAPAAGAPAQQRAVSSPGHERIAA